VCPGQKLALATISYVLFRVFQEFKTVEPRDDRAYRPHIRLVTSNANGVHVSLVPA